MAQKPKNMKKCGVLPILLMIVTGTIFGALGVVLAHIGMKYYPDYYLLFIFPIFLGFLLGAGLSLGARMGRCCRINIIVFLMVIVFSVIAYSALLFLNHYYDTLPERPEMVFDEFFQIKDDTQNFLAALPYISDYVAPVQQPEGMQARPHIGAQVMTYLTTTLPEHAFSQEPVVIGTIFDLALLAPIRDYLVFPGITRWNEELKCLEFDEMAVQPWMVWSAEVFLLWLVAFLKTLKGTKKARQKREDRFKKRGAWQPEAKHPVSTKQEKKGLFRQKEKEPALTPTLDVSPAHPEQEAVIEPDLSAQAGSKQAKKPFFSFRRKKKAEPETEEEVVETPVKEKKKKKKKKGWFGKKSKEKAPEPATETRAEADVSLEFPEEEQEQEQRYALVLHQYEKTRQNDLVLLIQQVSQVSEDRARKLLKVPSLLKRDVSAQDAQIAIDKFKQVQAQVKLITMEQLEDIQKKQQQTVRAPRPAQAQKPTTASIPTHSSETGDPGERYALILRKIDPAQRKQVLELLASLSNTPVAQLQQNLKTPALVLRDATKDEVTMIAQQFRKIQADVKMLTMAELQNLMTRK